MVLLVDSNHLLHRILHVPAHAAFTTTTGIHTGGVYGFIRSLRSTVAKFSPEKIVAVWDGGHSERRTALFPDYKAGRKETSPDREQYRAVFRSQREWLVKLLDSVGVNHITLDGREADDIMYRMSRGGFRDWLIMTEDRDLFQCITGQRNVTIWRPIAEDRTEGSGLVIAENFVRRTGVQPDYFVVLKAILGDPSDGIPGIPGVGEVTALLLIDKMKEPTVQEVVRQCDPKNTREMKVLKNIDIVVRNLDLIDLSKEQFTQEETGLMDKALTVSQRVNTQAAVDIMQQLEFESILRDITGFLRPFEGATNNG